MTALLTFTAPCPHQLGDVQWRMYALGSQPLCPVWHDHASGWARLHTLLKGAW